MNLQQDQISKFLYKAEKLEKVRPSQETANNNNEHTLAISPFCETYRYFKEKNARRVDESVAPRFNTHNNNFY